MLAVAAIVMFATGIAMIIKLYPHQQKAVKKLKTGSILCGGVGSGKSVTALAYFFIEECGGSIEEGELVPMQKPKDLYIITTARKRDSLEWDEDCSRFLLSTIREESIQNTQVVIDSWNNIGKYTDIQDAFFIFDEQRLVGSGAWVKAFYKIAEKNNWILLSATPGDTWMDYIPVFIANGFFKNRTEFLRNHVVFSRVTKYPKVERYIGERYLYYLRDRILVVMPFERETTRHVKIISVSHDSEKMKLVQKKRWNIFTEKPIKDAGEMYFVARRVSNENIQRLQAIVDLFKVHKRLIIFYNFDYELSLLRTLPDILPYKVVFAEYNGHKHEDVPKTNEWIYVVQYTAGSEAWNCISSNSIIFFSPHYSYKIMEQASGRIDRMNTPFLDLYYYILMSDAWIDRAIFSALKKKKNFEEKKEDPFLLA